MTAGIVVSQCRVCGVEYDTRTLPELCPICADDRQYLAPDGAQHWVDPYEYGRRHDGDVQVVELEPGLWAVNGPRGVGIGQQAKIIATSIGTVMVDAPAVITPSAIEAVATLGPTLAIIPSHPHMFGLQSLWSAALGNAPVYVSAADEHWLGARPAHLRLWDGALSPAPGVRASQPGGHFPGSSVVHWVGSDGKGVLLSSDTVGVNRDGKTASFMWSFPNYIPLSAAVTRRIVTHIDRYEFDRIYGNFPSAITKDAKARVTASADRHIAWLGGEFDHLT